MSTQHSQKPRDMEREKKKKLWKRAGPSMSPPREMEMMRVRVYHLGADGPLLFPLEMLKRAQFEPFQHSRISVLLTGKLTARRKCWFSIIVLGKGLDFFLVLPTFPEYRPHASYSFLSG